jgi:hypothetical protein
MWLYRTVVVQAAILAACIEYACVHVTAEPVGSWIEPCTNGRHVAGEWAYEQQVNKSFVCCGYDDWQYTFNLTACPDRAEINPLLFHGSTMFPPLAGGHACFCGDSPPGPYLPHSSEHFYWKPSYCSLPKFNAKKFCELLGSRKLLIIGDSTLMQTAATLFSTVWAQGGNCSDNFYSRRDNELYNIADWVNAVHPDIVVMGAGAHCHDLGDLNMVLDNLEINMRKIQTEYPNITLIWKTQNPGHLGCERVTGPQDNYPTWKLKYANDSLDGWNWNLQPAFDQISVRRLSQKGMKIVDMSPLYLRPDGHVFRGNFVDCLHYCLPGPVNLFNVLMQNMLSTKEI